MNYDGKHKLAHATVDGITQDVERWERDLQRLGWKRYRNMWTVWQAPSGALHQGPYGAWLVATGQRR